MEETNVELDGDKGPRDSVPLLKKQDPLSEESSDDIKDEDIESASEACCRICLESDGLQDSTNGNPIIPPSGDTAVKSGIMLIKFLPLVASIEQLFALMRNDDCKLEKLYSREELISPCMCKGTQQFVHRTCLDHWRSVKEGFAFSHCTTCKAQFHFRIELLEDYSWRKMKFRIFVARDVFLVFLAVQSVIALLGGFSYFLDRNGSFRNSFSDSWDRILSKHPIPFYYCLGVLMFLVLLGFFGLILHCSSLGGDDPYMSGCRNCCYGWGILDCFPASMEACFALVLIFVIAFAIVGVAYCFLAATMAAQRIWQRHYHILTKRELTKEYVVEDLRGCYTPSKMEPEHEKRLELLKLL